MPLEFRYAFRQLTKSPGFTFVAVLALALGIGANTALFSIVDSLFLRPLPFAASERLVHLTSSLAERNLSNVPFSYPRFQAVRARQSVFEDVAFGAFNALTLTGRGDPEQVQVFMASANFLPVLGVAPQLGRNFTDAEDRHGGAAVALVSDTFWRTHFNASPTVLGQTLTLDGGVVTIVGVLPAAASHFPFNRISVWLPRPAEVPFLVRAQLDNGSFVFEVIGRLKPGATVAQAQQQLNVIAAGYREANPRNVDAQASVRASRWLDDLVGDQRQTYVVLFGAVGCVLLIACANVANLLLARFTGRRKEIALRFALGARRGRVIWQLLIECLLVAFAGAAAGLVVACGALELFGDLGRNFVPRVTELAIAPTALAFTAALALATGLGMGVIPALSASRRDLNDALKDSARGSSGGTLQGRVRGALLVTEIALSLVLLIAASLLLTSFVRLQHVPLGFQPDRVFVGFLNVSPAKYPDKPRLVTFYTRLLERVSAVPGVTHVALNDAPPLSGNNAPAPVAVVGQSVPPLSERPLAKRHLVSPGMFATLGMSLVAGRDFDARDNAQSPQVVIINQALARKYFPDINPVGQKLITGMAQITAEIVGVVGDTRSGALTLAPAPEYFLPALQRPESFTALLVRTTIDPAGIAGAVRAALREVDPDLPLITPQTMPEMIAGSVADRRLTMVILGAFALLALVLAGIGVYSVMAYMVTQRTTEIGIRMALGATAAQVLALVLRQGMKLVAIGVGLGVVAAAAVSRLIETLLFGVGGTDPLIYAALSVVIAAIAALACLIPARRATRIDPIIALRAE